MSDNFSTVALDDLRRWHLGQATTYAKAATTTAMDHPELTTESLQRTAQWHEQQAALLQKVLDQRTRLALYEHVYGLHESDKLIPDYKSAKLVIGSFPNDSSTFPFEG